ncbi:MAG: alpha-amylase/4-alpha-glucanotransferase domain-containing protein [Thermogutta sp.]
MTSSTPRVRLVLLLHDHQPVGNFDHVFQQAYEDSYRPFLEILKRWEGIRVSLHTSGPLIEWLDSVHPGYLDEIAGLVNQGRIEIIGGPFYEPILAMIPSHDRVGQIRHYTRWLENRLGAKVRGMWVPERVWEQSFTKDIVAAGIEYTVLDDYHFKAAGLRKEQLYGYYLTEDEGRLLAVFPGSERLRYTIPFAEPHVTIEYLREIGEKHPNAVVVFGDDGEKFGTWPDTKKHVYEDRWLERFFEALLREQDWLRVCTLGEAYDAVSPLGKIYLPDCSYREMTEWALPTEQQRELESLRHEMSGDPRWSRVRAFIRGGYWRNFRVKYPEANEMYARMMEVSRRIQNAISSAPADSTLRDAQLELYRGQCNCPYWHGAFGGIYLPHLRNAVYEHLIAADNLIEQHFRSQSAWVDVRAEDFDFDGQPEVRLANDHMVAYVAPFRGGQLYEWDVRSIRRNLLATMTRRPEVYHDKVRAGASGHHEGCASIHDRVVFKQAGLESQIQYDRYPRKSLIDMFYSPETTLEQVRSGQAVYWADLSNLQYETTIHANPDRVRVTLSREATVLDQTVRVTKAILLSEGSPILEVAYRLENLPADRPLLFAVELNVAGLPANADDRFFESLEGARLGHLGTQLDLEETPGLALVDSWLGLRLQLAFSRPTNLWTFPVASVSQSEGGFELVHQSVAIQPHWWVTPDATGRWSVMMRFLADTSAASQRESVAELATASV